MEIRFENYERRIDRINECLKQNGIESFRGSSEDLLVTPA